MSLGYDTHDDDRDFEQEGITGEVRRFSTEKMSFPCLILISDDENKIPRHKLEVLKKMFSVTVAVNMPAEELSLGIDIYITDGERTIRLGKIYPRQVMAFLRLFEGNLVEGMMSEDVHLTGDYLYVLAD